MLCSPPLRDRLRARRIADGPVNRAKTATPWASSPATAEDIRALDVDVMPDGAACPRSRDRGGRRRGVRGEVRVVPRRQRRGARLSACGTTFVDSFAFATDASLVRTIGSYWPYATTCSITSRAMPFQSSRHFDGGRNLRARRLPAPSTE